MPIDQQYPTTHADPERVAFSIRIPIGGTGAVGTITGTPGFAAARASAGTYTFTFPKSVDVYVSPLGLESNAGTVKTSWFTTISAANGTGGFVTGNGGGTATDPASGDVLHLNGWVKYKGV